MSAIRALHITDLHFSPANEQESDTCVGEAVRVAEEEWRPQVVILTGDSTDHRLEVHSSALLALAKRIKEFSNLAPVLILQGTYSHEPPGTIEMFGLLSGEFPIAIANRICQVALTKENQWIFSEGAVFAPGEIDVTAVRTVITCLPTVNKANLAASLGAADASSEMGSVIQNYLQNVGPVNCQFGLQGIPTIGVSHGTVHGCITEHGVPMNGFDHEFTSEALFDAECSAFMLGHIHKHQSWDKGGRKIAYPGSIGRFHYGEEGDKGFLKWEVSAQASDFDFHVTPSRQMKLFDYDGEPDIEELKLAALDCKNAYVRVRWQIDQEHSQLVNREQIREIFKDASEVKIETRILKIQRTRADGINREHTLAAKLGRWCGMTGIDAGPLQERLELLAISNPIALANDVIRDISSFEDHQLAAAA